MTMERSRHVLNCRAAEQADRLATPDMYTLDTARSLTAVELNAAYWTKNLERYKESS